MDLVADIGATNARFQCLEKNLLVGEVVILPTVDFNDSADLLHHAMEKLGAPRVDAALLAVAGPVISGADRVEVTNTGLQISQRAAADVLGCQPFLVNDFFALAHGVPHFTEFEQMGGGEVRALTKAVLGPGTGLGMATLIPGTAAAYPSGWQVLASEGGHADLAPGSHLEVELWGRLATSHNPVSWETVLSGRGLSNLYEAMSAVWGASAKELSPGEILSLGSSMQDPICHQTLETFCALLGSAAGNLALIVGAAGGVYLAGGIVPRMLDFVRSSPLRRRFDERGDLSAYAEQIPLLIVTQTEPGIVGAAHCLRALAR
ncbi:MAG: glucokinase [bacterium]